MSFVNISTSRRRNRSGRGQTANNNNNNNQRQRGRVRRRRPKPRARTAKLRRVELIPSAVINRSVTQAPRMYSNGKNVIFRHSEYFRTLSSDTAEAFTGDLINPCNGKLFPWLALVAPSWERYRFRSLSFRFRTNCSTTFAGDLALAIDYDARDPNPTEFGEFSSHEGCVTGNYYGNLNLDAIVPNFDKQNRGWYLTAESEQTSELATFYGGKFETYTSAATAATPVGKLYVDYVIELNNPQPRDTNGLTTATLPDDKTVNDGASLFGNYVTQGGTAALVGNDIEITSSGLKFLKGGDYQVTSAVNSVTDAATLTSALTSVNGTSSTVFDLHDSALDIFSHTERILNVSAGDVWDFVVGAANMVITNIALSAVRYKSNSYI